MHHSFITPFVFQLANGSSSLLGGASRYFNPMSSYNSIKLPFQLWHFLFFDSVHVSGVRSKLIDTPLFHEKACSLMIQCTSLAHTHIIGGLPLTNKLGVHKITPNHLIGYSVVLKPTRHIDHRKPVTISVDIMLI